MLLIWFNLHYNHYNITKDRYFEIIQLLLYGVNSTAQSSALSLQYSLIGAHAGYRLPNEGCKL